MDVAPAARRRTPIIALTLLVLTLLGILGIGYWPRTARARQVAELAVDGEKELIEVSAARVKKAPADTDLSLPGSILAVTEAPIYARIDGYVSKRLVDIGDRVTKGQLLAEIESPEVEQQLRQARAASEQSQASLAQMQAALEQAKANARLAEITLKRTQPLVLKGVIAKQDGDEKEATYQARKADVAAAEANVKAAQKAIGAAEANVQRLIEILAFKQVRAPYDGLITARNVVFGLLVSSGSNSSIRELYRITQLTPLKISIQVPQSAVPYVHVGQDCAFEVQELPGRHFNARVTRTTNALDSASRSLTAEVYFDNPKGELLPGMYAQIHFNLHRDNPPLLLPGDAVVTGPEGTRIAVVRDDGTIHYERVALGRDYGAETEILSGLTAKDLVVLNPTDDLHEGTHVRITK